MPWKVVVVDDDPTVHKLIGRALPSGEFEVQSVQNPLQAFDEVKRLQPDLVILDLMMPKITGLEICQKLKESQETKGIRILILSAKESQEDRVRGLEIGADDYISKPFHLASLIRKIQYMLNEAKGTPTT